MQGWLQELMNKQKLIYLHPQPRFLEKLPFKIFGGRGAKFQSTARGRPQGSVFSQAFVLHQQQLVVLKANSTNPLPQAMSIVLFYCFGEFH